jgi:hypothetical protein
MISVIASEKYAEASSLSVAAIRRSVSKSQCKNIQIHEIKECTNILVAIAPDEFMGQKIIEWLQDKPRKLILLGFLPDNLIDFLNFKKVAWPDKPTDWYSSMSAPLHGFAESNAVIQYQQLIKELNLKIWQRPLERFDFADEWNNMGYGAIRFDQSIWSLAMPLKSKASSELASLLVDKKDYFSYASIHNEDQYSVLWFNRYVGPIDSFEWRIVENFISHYREEILPCYPVVKEIPWGHDAAVTMRLDCDENVASAQSLFDAYKAMDIPFSLAIHTSSFDLERDHSILLDVLKHRGSILSHSSTHAPNWGGSYENAKKEAFDSKSLIEKLTGREIRYAVSPFHQTPSYALKALYDVGYDGCVGGIIRNDPDFLMARGGLLTNMNEGFVGHSQQVMLHGDCILEGDQPLKIYQQSFDYAYESQTLFGFLDHPFSDRYQYGWENETSRIKTHQDFIQYIKTKAKKPIFLSEEDALDFLKLKSKININQDNEGFYLKGPDAMSGTNQTLNFSVEYRNKIFKGDDGVIFS